MISLKTGKYSLKTNKSSSLFNIVYKLLRIFSSSREDQFQRMVQIMDFFEQMFKAQKIRIICMEKLFFTKFNQNNAEFVYGIRWILLMMALKYGAEIREFSPIELKKYITGNGKADKLLVQKMIMKLFRLQELPEYNDAADALGLAYLAAKLPIKK